MDHGARVINASWGADDYSQALADAIAYANAHSVVFVTAAGNEGANNDVVPSYPADDRLPNVISVAAVDPPATSPASPTTAPRRWTWPRPGVNIRSTVPAGGTPRYSGTSMATPFVSGVVSLVVGVHPD